MKYPKPVKRTKEQRLKERILRLKAKVKQKKEPTLAKLKKTVRTACHKWIRERDKELPCISCEKWSDKFDAGHYVNHRSSGALRYNEENIHKQCSFNCNNKLSGNKIEYRINLIKKIGVKRVEWLEKHRRDIKKWTREELNSLLEKYKSFAFDNSR